MVTRGPTDPWSPVVAAGGAADGGSRGGSILPGAWTRGALAAAAAGAGGGGGAGGGSGEEVPVGAPVHAPFWPHAKREAWWILVSDPDKNRLFASTRGAPREAGPSSVAAAVGGSVVVGAGAGA